MSPKAVLPPEEEVNVDEEHRRWVIYFSSKTLSDPGGELARWFVGVFARLLGAPRS
jgi:hypothetical protein